MSGVITWLAGTSIGRTISAIASVLGVVVLAFLFGRRGGARRQKEKADERDRKRASDIRRDLDRERSKRLRPDEVIYRD